MCRTSIVMTIPHFEETSPDLPSDKVRLSEVRIAHKCEPGNQPSRNLRGLPQLVALPQLPEGDQQRAIEVQPTNVKPAAGSQPNQPPAHRLHDMRRQVVPARVEQAQVFGCIRSWPIRALVAVAGGTGVDEIIEFVTAAMRAGLKMIELQLVADGALGDAAVAAAGYVALPHQGARRGGDGHDRDAAGGAFRLSRA